MDRRSGRSPGCQPRRTWRRSSRRRAGSLVDGQRRHRPGGCATSGRSFRCRRRRRTGQRPSVPLGFHPPSGRRGDPVRSQAAGGAVPLICVRCMIRRARGIERVAPVHGAAVVPQHQVADPPDDACTARIPAASHSPEFVQQRLGLRQSSPRSGIAPAAEIQHAPPALRMGADQRMQRAGRVRGSSVGVTPWRT